MAVRRPCGVYNEGYAQEFAIVRTRLQWVLLIGGLVLLFLAPRFLSGYLLNLMNLIGISIIAVLGLNILTGYCGQVSIGQAAFMAVGAYTSALLVIKAGFSFWAALPCAAIASGIMGLIFGLPSLRIKGFYLAMATLAAQFVIPYLIDHIRPEVTGGVHGLAVPPIKLGEITFLSQSSLFYVIMPLVVLMTFFAKNLVRTKMGRAFIAIRDNDLAAEVMGINLFRYKLLAFFICSLYAGVAGSLWAFWMRSINTEHFGLMSSVWLLGMVIVGGLGSTAGGIFGVVFIRGLDELVRTYFGPWLGEAIPGLSPITIIPALIPIIFGLIIVLFLIFEPRGLAHRWEIVKASYRLWPFAY